MFTTIGRNRSGRTIAPGRARSESVLWQRIASGCALFTRWVARSRQRRALRELAERNDFHLLGDIGVSRSQAFGEADKPFWRD